MVDSWFRTYDDEVSRWTQSSNLISNNCMSMHQIDNCKALLSVSGRELVAKLILIKIELQWTFVKTSVDLPTNLDRQLGQRTGELDDLPERFRGKGFITKSMGSRSRHHCLHSSVMQSRRYDGVRVDDAQSQECKWGKRRRTRAEERTPKRDATLDPARISSIATQADNDIPTKVDKDDTN